MATLDSLADVRIAFDGFKREFDAKHRRLVEIMKMMDECRETITEGRRALVDNNALFTHRIERYKVAEAKLATLTLEFERVKTEVVKCVESLDESRAELKRIEGNEYDGRDPAGIQSPVRPKINWPSSALNQSVRDGKYGIVDNVVCVLESTQLHWYQLATGAKRKWLYINTPSAYPGKAHPVPKTTTIININSKSFFVVIEWKSSRSGEKAQAISIDSGVYNNENGNVYLTRVVNEGFNNYHNLAKTHYHLSKTNGCTNGLAFRFAAGINRPYREKDVVRIVTAEGLVHRLGYMEIDSSILNITTFGNRLFKFSSNGQVFTSTTKNVGKAWAPWTLKNNYHLRVQYMFNHRGCLYWVGASWTIYENKLMRAKDPLNQDSFEEVFDLTGFTISNEGSVGSNEGTIWIKSGNEVHASIDGGYTFDCIMPAEDGVTINKLSSTGSSVVVLDNQTDPLRYFNIQSSEPFEKGNNRITLLDSINGDNAEMSIGNEGEFKVIRNNIETVLQGTNGDLIAGGTVLETQGG